MRLLLVDLHLMGSHTTFCLLLAGTCHLVLCNRPTMLAWSRDPGYPMLTVAVSVLTQFCTELVLKSDPTHCQEGRLHVALQDTSVIPARRN